jgi:hypothetical protein
MVDAAFVGPFRARVDPTPETLGRETASVPTRLSLLLLSGGTKELHMKPITQN